MSRFDLDDDELQLQQWAHGFAEEVIRPTAAANDRHRQQPLDVLRSAFEAGLLTLGIPAENGKVVAGDVRDLVVRLLAARSAQQ